MPYTVQLSQFEGPLDVLLHLVARARVDIREIFISEITEQYLASMDQVDELDMDVASEFLQMAATLLEIKSRSLLPKPPKLEDGEEDPEETLYRRLEEYKQYKDAGERLKGLEKTASLMLYRLPDELVADHRVELTGMTLDMLISAFSGLLKRAVEPEAGPGITYIPRETLSVQECMFRIQSRLRAGAARFSDLFGDRPSKSEVVTVFIALLELWKMGYVKVTQSSTYGEIELEGRALRGSGRD